MGDAARESDRLRVALLVGGLGQGGAEKQLLYMAQSLARAGVDVRLYTLTAGEFYEASLKNLGLEIIPITGPSSPALRVLRLGAALRRFRPHVLQATHFFVNLYVALLQRTGPLGIGSIRNDTLHELEANGRWGPWLLKMPEAMLANSEAARHNAASCGRDTATVHVVPNVIDLAEFDRRAIAPSATPALDVNSAPTAPSDVVAVAVARLVPAKRLERFVLALAAARRQCPRLSGVILGEGPERASLERLAAAQPSLKGGLRFEGACAEVPRRLKASSLLVLSSDHEGFPNVVLEAMAAGLPVVTTPAGDAAQVVEHGVTGYVVARDDVSGMADRMIALASSTELRQQLGAAGRARAEQEYSPAGLADRLFAVYRQVAERRGAPHLARAIAGQAAPVALRSPVQH